MKYYDASGDSVYGIIGSRGCAGAGEGAYVNDTLGSGCWAMHGVAIIIGDTIESYMAGFEKINWMYRAEATQPALPCCYNLNAPFSGKV